MNIYIKVFSTLILALILLLLMIANDNNIIYKELSELGMSRPTSPGCHVWVFFVFFPFQLIWLSFTLHFPCKESLIMSRSNDFKAHWRENENIQNSPRDLISLQEPSHYLGPLLFLAPFCCYWQYSQWNWIIYPLTWRQLSL